MEHFVTIDSGVTDADFREAVQALVVNHHPDKTFTVRTEDRIPQVFSWKNLMQILSNFLIKACWV